MLENVSINHFTPKGEYDLSAHRVGTRGLGGSLTPWIYFANHIIRNKKKDAARPPGDFGRTHTIVLLIIFLWYKNAYAAGPLGDSDLWFPKRFLNIYERDSISIRKKPTLRFWKLQILAPYNKLKLILLYDNSENRPICWNFCCSVVRGLSLLKST